MSTPVTATVGDSPSNSSQSTFMIPPAGLSLKTMNRSCTPVVSATGTVTDWYVLQPPVLRVGTVATNVPLTLPKRTSIFPTDPPDAKYTRNSFTPVRSTSSYRAQSFNSQLTSAPPETDKPLCAS